MANWEDVLMIVADSAHHFPASQDIKENTSRIDSYRYENSCPELPPSSIYVYSHANSSI